MDIALLHHDRDIWPIWPKGGAVVGGGRGVLRCAVHATTLRDGIDSKTTSVTCYGQPTRERFASLDF